MSSNERCSISMENDSTGLFFSTYQQFLESTKPQTFPLPMPIMKYIWKNPSSPEVYQKLIKSCKLFFLKNPILVLKNLKYCLDSGWRYCDSKKCSNWGCKNKHKKIDIDNLHGKIWLLKSFDGSHGENAKLASTLIPQIYRSDVKNLYLSGQHLSYNELQFLSSSVKNCSLLFCTIKYEDNDEYVSMVDIIKLFSGAEYVYMNFLCQLQNAFCKSYDEFIVACNNVEKVELCCLPADFDVQEFYQRLKSSKNRTSIIISSLCDNGRLNEVINEILATTVFEFVPPVIFNYNISKAKIKRLYETQKKEAAKYLE